MDKKRRPSKRNSIKENKKHPYKKTRIQIKKLLRVFGTFLFIVAMVGLFLWGMGIF